MALTAGDYKAGMPRDERSSTPNEEASPLVQALIVLVAGPFGTALFLQGFGWHGADFLHPNPTVPPFVFGVIGVFTLCAALIVTLKALCAPRWMYDLVGWSMMAAGFVVMNWVVLFSGAHAACFIGPVPSLVLGGYGSMACDWMAGAVVVICDAVAVLIFSAEVLRWVGQRLPL